MSDSSNLLCEAAQKFGLSLTQNQLDDFEKYYKALKIYNSHTNLISNDDKAEVFLKHFADSLAFALLNPQKKDFSMLDIGCGGGFPGVPLLIAYPEACLCAVDSVGKKIKFINELSQVLNLQKRLTMLNMRAEDLPQDCRESFDYALARAVAPLGMLIEYCVPYLKVGGILAAYKSKTAQEEIAAAQNALKLLNSEVIEVKDSDFSQEYTRNIVLIRKNSKTDSKYPRKNGFVKKYPI